MQQSPTAPIAETNGNGQDTAREAARRARGTRAQKVSSRQEQAYLSFHVHIDDVLADKALHFDKLRPESKSASCSMHAESSSFKILEIVERDADSNGTDSPSNDLFIQNKIDTSKCGDDVRVVGLFGDENNNRYQDDSHNYENKSSVNSRNESDSHDDGFEVFDEFAECGDDFITSDRVDFEPNGDIFDDSLLSTFKVIRQPIEDQILVRPFNIEDFEPCISLLISSLNTFRSMSRVDAKKLLDNVTVDQVIDAAPYTVVATVQGSSVIVGLAGARMVHDDSIGSLMELRSLVVRPSFRNQEIAKMMVSALAHLGYELRLEQMVHNPQKSMETHWLPTFATASTSFPSKTRRSTIFSKASSWRGSSVCNTSTNTRRRSRVRFSRSKTSPSNWSTRPSTRSLRPSTSCFPPDSFRIKTFLQQLFFLYNSSYKYSFPSY